MSEVTEPPAQTDSPLTEAQWRELAAAKRRAAPIRRAVGMAKFDAWSTAFLSMLAMFYCVATSMLGFDFVVLFVAVGLGVVAYQAFQGAAELRRFDPVGPKRLGLNQIGLFGVVVVYCIWRIISVFWMPTDIFGPVMEYLSVINAQTGGGSQMDVGDVQKWVVLAVCGVYTLVIIVSLIYQGLMAIYYFGRGRLIREYIDKTPSWVIELVRAVVA